MVRDRSNREQRQLTQQRTVEVREASCRRQKVVGNRLHPQSLKEFLQNLERQGS